MSGPRRADLLLPATIAGAALALGISELMITFRFEGPGGEVLTDQLAGDRHGYAMLLLAVFALAAMVLAVLTGLRAAAWATAGFGVAALVIFLAVDLPDVNQLGDIEDPGVGLVGAKAEPQPGFWLEAAAAVVLALASVAFATLSSEALQAPKRWFESRRHGRPEDTTSG